MSIIQQKLKENKSRLRKEKILSALEPPFSDFLSQAECEIDLSYLKNFTHQRWDNDTDDKPTNPERAICCNKFTFRSWSELITLLKKFQQVKNYIGWFFLDPDGPYFRISLNAFLSHVPHISDYGTQNDHYYFGWVGDSDNVGIIIGQNATASSDKKFNITLWGI